MPSNSLACLYTLTKDVGSSHLIGEDCKICIDAYDESNTRIPVQKIINRIKKDNGNGVVCLVGVQTNQFPRAIDLARCFRREGIRTLIGGFHVSGCVSMLPDLPAELKDAISEGITLVAGEIEGRWGRILMDAYLGKLAPLYNLLDEKPPLKGSPPPIMPTELIRRYVGKLTTIDAGRGCPFECSFCTVINVQGRKSRGRTADEVECAIRENFKHGIRQYFITDDNFSRHRDWEEILDRIISLREKERIKIRFIIQVDTACHRIPRFIEKAAKAGCSKVFIGLENINPESLKGTGKKQNHIEDYKEMLMAWRRAGVITCAGYIIGFPDDTYESFMKDLEIIKHELPIDLMEFFILTPLPGSEDHRRLYVDRVWMDPDLNRYDTEHAIIRHKKMSKEEWVKAYQSAWEAFYSPEHIETIFKRAGASHLSLGKLTGQVLWFYGSIKYEGVHPLQAGILRMKNRRSRRPGLPLENPLIFYPRQLLELIRCFYSIAGLAWRLHRIRKRVQDSPDYRSYTDAAMEPALSSRETQGMS